METEEVKQIEEAVVEQATVENDGTLNMPEINEENGNQVPVFEMPSFEEEAQIPQEQEAWKKLVKEIPKYDLLKEAGLSDFEINLIRHAENGGKYEDYLHAKAMDYKSVPDLNLIKAHYKESYANLSDEDIEALIEKEYALSEYDDEREKKIGQAKLKRDAFSIRSNKIKEQAAFKIKERELPQQVTDNSEHLEKIKTFYETHPNTQKLTESKSVAFQFGKDGVFNLAVDNPAVITKILSDPTGKLWGRLINTQEGVPNVELQQQLAVFAANPKRFVETLINYGKGLALHDVITENQNAVKPSGQPASPPSKETLADAFKKRARVSTYGD